jgi:hypothetical protein
MRALHHLVEQMDNGAVTISGDRLRRVKKQQSVVLAGCYKIKGLEQGSSKNVLLPVW